MASVFVTLLLGVLVWLCVWMYVRYNYWKRKGIRTAKGWYPVVGHLLPVITVKEGFSDMIRRIYNDNKDQSMIGMYKALTPILLIREPGLVKTVLQLNFSSFHENGVKIIPEVDPLLAKNPFFNYGETWSTGRKRLTYAFSSMRLKILFAAVNGVCKKFENFVNRRLESTAKYEVELKYLFQKFTGEVVANAGLGIEGQCFNDKADAYAFDEIGKSIFQVDMIQGLMMMVSLFFPSLNRLLKIKVIPKEVDEFFKKIVAENLEHRRKEATPRNDFLQLMMELEKSGEKMDESAIVAHAFSFFADGFETSSITLSFIGFQLAVHQDVQEKLRNEVKTVIEKHGGELTYEALKKMPYMDMVISESQRFYPAVGFLTKLCTESFELQGSDGISCTVETGTEIIIATHAMQFDPQYWTDPDVFDPERFSEERKQSVERMAFLPFGEGPRACVGMRMALLQMKACLATFVNNYKVELSPKTKLPLKLSPYYFLSSPIGGLWVNVSKL